MATNDTNLSTPHLSTSEAPIDAEQKRLVSVLSIHSLRVELHRRKLSTAGLRPALEARLAQDLMASIAEAARKTCAATRRRRRPNVHISVPICFNQSSSNVLSALSSEKKTSANDSAIPSSSILSDVEVNAVTIPKLKSSEEPSNLHKPSNGEVEKRPGDDRHETKFAQEEPSEEEKHSLAEAESNQSKYEGILRGRSVWITGQEQMDGFWQSVGPCGKANLSRSAPSFNVLHSLPEASLKGRAMRQLLTMEEQAKTEERRGVEHLQLTLVEAYYAAFVKRKLVIKDRTGKLLTDQRATWALFCKQEHFAAMFVAFCRYRAAGWLPRSGIKYGVDWVLYPTGKKRHTHAPYCVALQWEAALDRRWIRLQNRLRLVKNVAKTLILARVQGSGASVEEAFRNVKIREVTVDRWLP